MSVKKRRNGRQKSTHPTVEQRGNRGKISIKQIGKWIRMG
jgi:hypothetical protein